MLEPRGSPPILRAEEQQRLLLFPLAFALALALVAIAIAVVAELGTLEKRQLDRTRTRTRARTLARDRARDRGHARDRVLAYIMQVLEYHPVEPLLHRVHMLQRRRLARRRLERPTATTATATTDATATAAAAATIAPAIATCCASAAVDGVGRAHADGHRQGGRLPG